MFNLIFLSINLWLGLETPVFIRSWISKSHCFNLIFYQVPWRACSADAENYFILTTKCNTWQNYKIDWCSLQEAYFKIYFNVHNYLRPHGDTTQATQEHNETPYSWKQRTNTTYIWITLMNTDPKLVPSFHFLVLYKNIQDKELQEPTEPIKRFKQVTRCTYNYT
jgi:hypothetical protein